MTEYLTEQEQIEQLKKWLRVYGIPALLGILAGIALFYGWNHYQSHRLRSLSHASRIYDEMLTDRAQNNDKATLTQAGKLFTHYPKTSYGDMAALMLAHEAVVKKNYGGALQQLTWVMKHGRIPATRQIARLRIARIQIADQKPQEALALLEKVEDKAFNGLINEVRGDAYLALRQNAEAQQAYQHALADLPNSEEIRPLLEMKLDNVVA